MQPYNYAEEIIKDYDLSLVKNQYIRINIPKDEILNDPADDSIVDGNDVKDCTNANSDIKAASYKESLKNNAKNTVEESKSE